MEGGVKQPCPAHSAEIRLCSLGVNSRVCKPRHSGVCGRNWKDNTRGGGIKLEPKRPPRRRWGGVVPLAADPLFIGFFNPGSDGTASLIFHLFGPQRGPWEGTRSLGAGVGGTQSPPAPILPPGQAERKGWRWVRRREHVGCCPEASRHPEASRRPEASRCPKASHCPEASHCPAGSRWPRRQWGCSVTRGATPTPEPRYEGFVALSPLPGLGPGFEKLPAPSCIFPDVGARCCSLRPASPAANEEARSPNPHARGGGVVAQLRGCCAPLPSSSRSFSSACFNSFSYLKVQQLLGDAETHPTRDRSAVPSPKSR